MAKKPKDGVQWQPDPVGYVALSERGLKMVNRILAKCDLVYRGYTDTDGNPSPCWEWLGGNSGNGDGAGRGYGRIKIDSQVSATHRVMFSCFHGYLPPKRDVDHKCHNRICCNPDHLESVTRKKNMNNLKRHK